MVSGTKDLGIEYRTKDLGIFCDGSCADNIKSRLQLVYQHVFQLKAVSSIKRLLLGPKAIASTMKEEQPAILALLDG